MLDYAVFYILDFLEPNPMIKIKNSKYTSKNIAYWCRCVSKDKALTKIDL